MKKILVPLILSFWTCFAMAQPEIQVSDLTRIQSVSNVSYSPEGDRILFTVTSIKPDPRDPWEYQYGTQLWIGDAQGNGLRPLTWDGASSPSWSPDGKNIAFVRGIEGKAQVFILPLEGGEAWQLTREKNGAANPVWSPDGSYIVFNSLFTLADLAADSTLNAGNSFPEWPMEKAGFRDNAYILPSKTKANPNGTLDEIRTYLALNEKDRKAKVINKLVFQQEATTSNDLSFSHLFRIEVKAGAKARAISSGFYSFSNAGFIGNSPQLLVQTDLDQKEHPDRSLESEVYTLSQDGNLQKLLGKDGLSFGQAQASPDGKWMAFTRGETNRVGIPALAIMPVRGKERDIKVIPHDRTVGNLKFSPDGTSLYFTSPSNGGVVLYRLRLEDLKKEQLSGFDEGIGSFDVSRDNQLAFVKTRVSSPYELFISDRSLKNQKPVTTLNTSWLKDKHISYPEKFTFTNDQGMNIEYWVMKPVGFAAGKQYPVVLNIHGGPSAMWGPGEASMWHEFQYWCGKGYGLVYCNPRGSGGYGQEFLRANIKDWGKGPTDDVLKALDGAASQGWIDTSRMVVTGGSYAGYLVAWIIGHDHRFKAACSQRGVYDLKTFFGEGNAWRLVPGYFGGYPWEPATRDILERESTINYVQQVGTPLIIFHGEQDLRTGVIQSEQFYKSLKVMGKTVEYVRHPGATHELTRSGNNRQRIDQMLRTWEFFERFIHPNK
ncbi:MAG TPA: S9 family peptidase [Saprospiraceae bacterium]|nr:S9 family peptidase [Saprospiraceae bacterium]HNT19207.1 S9 family peptidase [Saprospiraceae bacterium]